MQTLVISTERLNEYGFRLLTDGGDVTDYLKNPVLLYDHTRRYGENNDQIILPIGRLNNLRKENSQLVGDPEFDLDDDFAKKVASKFEKGYLNAASPGFEIITLSDHPSVMLPGQKLPTVTQWRLKEVSITDIPANGDAVKLSYQGRTICLNGKSKPEDIETFLTSTQPIMKKTIQALNATGLINLPESATDEMVSSAVSSVAAQLSARSEEITRLKGELKTAQDQVKDIEVQALKSKATGMVEAALAARKIVAGEKEHLIKLASASEEMFKATEESLKLRNAYMGVNSQITTPADETDEQRADEYRKLHKEGKLAQLKAANPDRFKAIADAFKAQSKIN
jgi:uncharacterized protein (UPF0335 family)